MTDDKPYCGRCRTFCNGANALCPCCRSIGVAQRHRLAEDTMRAYEARIPGAREARLRDPQSSYSWELLRHLLAVADAAMQDEGITPRSRQRVLSAVVYGGGNPADAEQRAREHEQYVRLMGKTQTPDIAALKGGGGMPDAIRWLGEENCAEVFALLGWDHPGDELDHSRIYGLGAGRDETAQPGDWIVPVGDWFRPVPDEERRAAEGD